MNTYTDNEFVIHKISQLDFNKSFTKYCADYLDFQSYFRINENNATYYCVSRKNLYYDFIMLHYSQIYQLGYWLAPKLRGRGLSQHYFKAAFPLLTMNVSKCLFSIIDNENKPSQKLVLQFGFKVMADHDDRKVFVWYKPRSQ